MTIRELVTMLEEYQSDTQVVVDVESGFERPYLRLVKLSGTENGGLLDGETVMTPEGPYDAVCLGRQQWAG